MANPIKFLGIITARKGSKRISGKNTKLCAGKPLIQWTIEAAKQSRIDETYLSTDCDVARKIALREKLICPDLRPDSLSGDTATSYSVVEHVLEQYKKNKIEVENIVLLQPTSPLRTAADINEAIELYELKGRSPVQSYSPAECPPGWCTKINPDLSLPGNHTIGKKSSSEYGPYYRINGAIYILSVEDFYSKKSFVPDNSYCYKMPRERGIDVDEELDFKIADFLLASSTQSP
jgi:N-acylneuraminate cytidylyltransferase